MRNIECFSHALPVPQRSFHAPLYLTHAGWERIKPGQAYPELKPTLYDFSWDEGRTLPEFCLAHCTAGSGMLETEAGRQTLLAGDAFFYRPGEWHRHRPVKSGGWTLLWIAFNGDLPYRWMNEGAFVMDGSKPIIKYRDLFEQQFERLLVTAHQTPTWNSEELSWQAIGLLSHFVTGRQPESTASERRPNDVVGQAVEFIWNHTHKDVSVADVALHAGCSRRTLETRFKQTMGITVLDEILNCRTERALHLLKSTDLPVKQIVFRSGFQSYEQMRQVFRRKIGKTPSDFRPPSG